MFLCASSTIKILKIIFYNWVGIEVSVIQAGFMIIYSLFLYLFVSSDCKRNGNIFWAPKTIMVPRHYAYCDKWITQCYS